MKPAKVFKKLSAGLRRDVRKQFVEYQFMYRDDMYLSQVYDIPLPAVKLARITWKLTK